MRSGWLIQMDNLEKQARQGSVAAIIQILNEQLADLGVRTRAVFAEGVLQILCEAATVEQLDQSRLITRMQHILESIAPLKLRRVRINSRLVREQQMLWLEEINRDPDNQLLWSQEIILSRPNILLRFWRLLKQGVEILQAPVSKQEELARVSRLNKQSKRSFWRGLLGGLSLSVLIFLTAWFFYQRRLPSTQTPDNFAQAVQLATEASIEGQTAQTYSQWSNLAAKWQNASELMRQVPPEDQRYATAQDRVKLYLRNSQTAQQRAKELSSHQE